MILSMALLGVLALAGCNQDTPAVTPTTAPTTTVVATPAPTVVPKDDQIPTLAPTNAPVEVESTFAMISPVPQSEVVDIVGTMSIDTYPRVDGSTATLPLS